MKPIIWNREKRRLLLLDQRLLPHRVTYRRYSRPDEVAGAIADMVIRGAPAIGIAGAFGLVLSACRLARAGISGDTSSTMLQKAYHNLKNSRPTAVNLAWGLDRLWKMYSPDMSPDDVARIFEEEAVKILEEDIEVNKKIGENGAALIPHGARILTHCNAGALATGGYGTALGVVRTAHGQGKVAEVYAGETRPYLQGARLTALELKEDGIPVTLITDSCAGYMMSKGKIDLVIVGADRIAANGDVANKIGTYSLAVLARHHKIPFYVAAPLSTIDPGLDHGGRIVIENRDPREVTHFQGKLIAPGGGACGKPLFRSDPCGTGKHHYYRIPQHQLPLYPEIFFRFK